MGWDGEVTGYGRAREEEEGVEEHGGGWGMEEGGCDGDIYRHST